MIYICTTQEQPALHFYLSNYACVEMPQAQLGEESERRGGGVIGFGSS